MPSRLVCFNPSCRAEYAATAVLYACTRCDGLLEAKIDYDRAAAAHWKHLWRQRRLSNAPLDLSGVWRYREMLDLFDGFHHVVTLREGNTPLLPGPRAAAYAGLDHLVFKHQGFNPTGSFKDNGMTCGATQAMRLGLRRVACVSTGNTSASMAAYAATAGLDPIIFIPNGNIAFGKLSQALDYGARTLQVDANFDQILALVRLLADRLGISPDDVAERIEHALFARRPKGYYLIGNDARFLDAMQRVVPVRVRDRILRRLLGV